MKGFASRGLWDSERRDELDAMKSVNSREDSSLHRFHCFEILWTYVGFHKTVLRESIKALETTTAMKRRKISCSSPSF